MTQSAFSNQQTMLASCSGFEHCERRDMAISCHAEWEQLVQGFAFVLPEAAHPDLQVRSKQEAIEALVHALVRAGAVRPEAREELAAAVVRREELATTGIGEGVAIPHTKHASVNEVAGALAYCQQGLDFASLDGRPVHLILLLASPPSDSRAHLLALEAAARRIAEPRWAPWRNGTAGSER